MNYLMNFLMGWEYLEVKMKILKNNRLIYFSFSIFGYLYIFNNFKYIGTYFFTICISNRMISRVLWD